MTGGRAVGGGIKLKPGKLIVPLVVVIDTLPVAPLPTMARIVVSDKSVNDDAETPPNITLLMLLKFLPFINITAPVLPSAGANEAMAGRAGTLKSWYKTKLSVSIPLDTINFKVSFALYLSWL